MKEITRDMVRKNCANGRLYLRDDDNNSIYIVAQLNGNQKLNHLMRKSFGIDVNEYVRTNTSDKIYEDILSSIGRTVDERSVLMSRRVWDSWYSLLSGELDEKINHGIKRTMPIYDGT